MRGGEKVSRYSSLSGAMAYADSTRDVDTSSLRNRFLTALPDRPLSLLEIGPGSGRDAKAFASLGHSVEAIDPNPAMARLASEFAGIEVHIIRAQDLDRQAAFDGIWACASLLHVPWSELPETLRRLERALLPGGVIYASFKVGETERRVDDLVFTDMDEERIGQAVGETLGLEVLETWRTGDLRPQVSDRIWFNVLLRGSVTPLRADSATPGPGE